jgi:hypothetical protein
MFYGEMTYTLQKKAAIIIHGHNFHFCLESRLEPPKERNLASVFTYDYFLLPKWLIHNIYRSNYWTREADPIK